jgi:ketosteroid isomerase-like protein
MPTTTTDMNKAIIRSYYEGSARGDLVGFGAQLHRDFVCSTPRYLPWGGDVHGAVAFIARVLPQIARVLDFGRFSCDSLLAEGDRVVALIDVGIRDTRASVKVSEHWRLDAGKVLSLWAAYFEPAALLARIARNGSIAHDEKDL